MDLAATNPIARMVAELERIIVGKPTQVRQAVTCLLANGHLLIEDLPGVGKTTMAQALAMLTGLEFRRVQFTSDLLPADIVGSAIYRPKSGEFQFQPGPVFTNIMLADEVNRATPRAQSALLEAMEERRVSVEGESRELPDPFFVIATQNPLQQIGTYPLPESQLDRFLMRISMGYPPDAAEKDLLKGEDRRAMLRGLQPVLNADALVELHQQVNAVHVSDALVTYVQDLMRFSRETSDFIHGLSPRAGLAWLRAGRAAALLAGRDMVVPEDLQGLAAPVLGHRLAWAGEASGRGNPGQYLADTIPVT